MVEKNYESLEYPDGYLPVIYEPYNKEFLLFPDSLEILMEDLGYHLDYVHYNEI